MLLGHGISSIIEAKERCPIIDNIKSFAILLVVLGHSIQYTMSSTFDSNYLFRLIYSFHMPLFMFVSGYVSFFSRNIKIKKKAKALLLPYLSWSIIYYCIFHRDIFVVEYFKSILFYPDCSLWFLYILFLCYVVFFLLNKVSTIWASRMGFLFALLIMGVPVSLFGLGLFKWYFLFFVFGRLYGEYRNLLSMNKICVLGVALPVFVFLSYYWYRNTPLKVDEFAPIINTVYRVSVPCIGIVTIFSLFKVIGSRFNYFGKLLGTRTLEIYSSHFMFLSLLVYCFANGCNITLEVFVIFVNSILMSLLFAKLSMKFSFLKLILFGK